jgi:hypothetical protein
VNIFPDWNDVKKLCLLSRDFWQQATSALLRDVQQHYPGWPALRSWRDIPGDLLARHWKVAAVMLAYEGQEPLAALRQMGIEPDVDACPMRSAAPAQEAGNDAPFYGVVTWHTWQVWTAGFCDPRIEAKAAKIGTQLLNGMLDAGGAAWALEAHYAPICADLGIATEQVDWPALVDLARDEAWRERQGAIHLARMQRTDRQEPDAPVPATTRPAAQPPGAEQLALF